MFIDKYLNFYYCLVNESFKLHAKITPLSYIKYKPTTIDKLPRKEYKELNNDEIIKVTQFDVSSNTYINGK